MPYNPAIPLLGTYLEKTITQKDSCTPMFIAVLFAVARTQKELKCPSTEEWIKKMWYVYTHTYIHYGILLSHIKNEIMTFAVTQMDLETITQKQIYDITHVECNLKLYKLTYL